MHQWNFNILPSNYSNIDFYTNSISIFPWNELKYFETKYGQNYGFVNSFPSLNLFQIADGFYGNDMILRAVPMTDAMGGMVSQSSDVLRTKSPNGAKMKSQEGNYNSLSRKKVLRLQSEYW